MLALHQSSEHRAHHLYPWSAMISKVLVAVKPGFTESSSLRLAKVLARQFKFDLLLYSAVHEDQGLISRYGTADALQNIEKSMLKSELQRLDELKQHFDGLCTSVSVEAQWQTPVAQGITDAAENFGAELVLLSGTTHGKLQRLFMAHTDWEVIRRARVPVLVSQNPELDTYANILAAVDPTHRHDRHELLNNSVLSVSEQLRSHSGGELYLGHVFPPREDPSIEACMPPIDEFDSWLEYRKAAMQKLAEEHQIDATHTRQVSGSPANGIVEMAEALSSDLVVMGALSRTFRNEKTLGTIAEKVLNRLDCDILFVPLDS